MNQPNATKDHSSSIVESSKINTEKESDQNEYTKRLPYKILITYGVGYISCGWTTSIIGFFILPFFIDVLSIKPSHYSIIQIVAQTWNALTDPLAGLLSDRTNSKFGRRRPWMFLSSFTFSLSFIFLFNKLEFRSYNFTVIYYSFFFILFYGSQTCFNIPYSALIMDISDNVKERNRVVTYQTSFYAIGVLLGTTIHGLFIYNIFNDTLGSRFSSIIAGIIVFISIMVTVFSIKERNIKIKKWEFYETLKSILDLLKNKSYIMLTVIYALSNIAMQSMQANLELYMRISLKLTNTERMIIIITILISAVFFLFVLKFFLSLVGKKTTYLIGSCAYLTCIVVLVFIPPKLFWVMLPIAFIAGCGTANTMAIVVCMLPDVIDEDYIKTGKNREGLFFSLFIFFQKISLGIVHAISGYVFELYGYDRELHEQPPQLVNAIRYLMGIPAGSVILISFVFLFFYPLNTKKINENKKILAEMNARTDTEDI